MTGFKAYTPLEVGDVVKVRGEDELTRIVEILFVTSASSGATRVEHYVHGNPSPIALDEIEYRIGDGGRRIAIGRERVDSVDVRTE